MIGQIESYDPETQTGVITSEGNRFTFDMENWVPDVTPDQGDDVVFEANENTALDVNLVGIYLEKPKAVKYKYLAAILGILFGFAGAHRIYLGYYRKACYQIALSAILVYTGFIVFAPQWGFIEAILIIANHITKDAKGRPLK